MSVENQGGNPAEEFLEANFNMDVDSPDYGTPTEGYGHRLQEAMKDVAKEKQKAATDKFNREEITRYVMDKRGMAETAEDHLVASQEAFAAYNHMIGERHDLDRMNAEAAKTDATELSKNQENTRGKRLKVVETASNKKIYYLAAIVGSTIGGYLPTLFGADMFSLWGIVSSAFFAFLLIFVAYKFVG